MTSAIRPSIGMPPSVTVTPIAASSIPKGIARMNIATRTITAAPRKAGVRRAPCAMDSPTDTAGPSANFTSASCPTIPSTRMTIIVTDSATLLTAPNGLVCGKANSPIAEGNAISASATVSSRLPSDANRALERSQAVEMESRLLTNMSPLCLSRRVMRAPPPPCNRACPPAPRSPCRAHGRTGRHRMAGQRGAGAL